MLKQIFSITIIGFFSLIFAGSTKPMNFSANVNHAESILDSNQFNSLNVTAAEQHLISGSWSGVSHLSEENYHHFLFKADGTVDLITDYAGENLGFSSHFWDLATTNSGLQMVLTEVHSGSSTIMNIHAITKDLIHVDVNGSPVTFRNLKAKMNGFRSDMESAIAGSWKMETYPFDVTNDINRCGAFEVMNEAYLNYTFLSDGTYQTKLGNHMVDLEESGIWEISEDGQFLIFYASTDGNPENIYNIHVARIRNICEGNLTLKQALFVPVSDFDTLFCTDMKDFAMTKTEPIVSTSNLVLE